MDNVAPLQMDVDSGTIVTVNTASTIVPTSPPPPQRAASTN